MKLNTITERITGWLWYSICVNLRLSSEWSERAVAREGTAEGAEIRREKKLLSVLSDPCGYKSGS